MKNRLSIYILFIFCICTLSFADQFKFEVSKIDIIDKGDLIYATDGKAISKDNSLIVEGKKFKYNKSLNLLNVFKGVAFLELNNLKIEFNELIVDEKNFIITAKGGVKIYDLEHEMLIRTETIILDRNKNIFKSSSESVLKDKFNNLFKTNKFEYKINENILKIENLNLIDVNNNKFEVELAYLNTVTHKLIGKDVSINLNDLSFNKNNEPRLKGNSLEYQNGTTKITKGIFTPCKKTDKCPPWQLSAEKITHDNKKKIINYKNVWLKIYDIPVVYFPKFFHPDPTVKRQSGFLMPSFKNSPNGNSYFSLPYYKVLSDNKDITFTPRLFAQDQILLQNEYREINNNSQINSDFSIFAEKDKSLKSHLFYELNKNFNYSKFENSKLNIKIEQTTNDTYLKGNKIISPLISNYDVLQNSMSIEMVSDDLTIESDIIMYENLTIKTTDRYEYIFPKIDLTKELENKTPLNGNLIFKSNNHIQNYQTNILEKVNVNNFIFNSFPVTTNKGFYNNYEFIIKNSNTDTKNSSNYKKNDNYYLSGLFQFNSSFPLIKNTDNHKRILKPKFALKLSPNNTKDLSKHNNKLDINNIYNLERISSSNTIEGGISLTYGNDFIILDLDNSRELLSFKIANNLRLEENDDLPKTNQLSSKTSNFFGEILYNPNDYFNTKYNFSKKNNLQDISYENFETEIKFNNFVTTFDYLNENNHEKNSYLLNKTSYSFDESNDISFATRKNKKTNLTEYYNLIYQYKNDCLKASIEYNKDYYNDRDIKPKESIFLKLTIVPFGQTSTPNLRK